MDTEGRIEEVLQVMDTVVGPPTVGSSLQTYLHVVNILLTTHINKQTSQCVQIQHDVYTEIMLNYMDHMMSRTNHYELYDTNFTFIQFKLNWCYIQIIIYIYIYIYTYTHIYIYT